MRKILFVLLSGLMSGVWAVALTVAFFGFIPTLFAVFPSGFVSGVLGISTIIALERMARKK
jgi:hypothetical protein